MLKKFLKTYIINLYHKIYDKKEKGEIFMKIKIVGKELKVTEALNDYVEKK